MYNVNLNLFLEPPIKRWKEKRALSQEAFEQACRLCEPLLSETERREYAGRVIYPHGAIAQMMLGDYSPRKGLHDEEKEKLLQGMRHMASFNLNIWINNVWGIDKALIVYEPDENLMLGGSDWWRSYTTDYVIGRFAPRMIYVSLLGLESQPGKGDLYEGAYVGFDFFDGEVRLAVLHVTRKGDLDPFYLHEFTFRPGMTLGEVVDGYHFSSPYKSCVEATQLRASKGKFTPEEVTELFRKSGQAIAARVLPLVLGLLGDEFIVIPNHLDVNSFDYEQEDVEFPERSRSTDPVAEIKDATEEAALFYIEHVKLKKMDLN